MQESANTLLRIKTRYLRALKYQNNDPEVALNECRKTAEAVLKELYSNYAALNPKNQHFKKPAEKQMLNNLASALEKVERYPLVIASSIRTIQAFGNIGSHDQGLESEQLTEDNIQVCMVALKNLVEWYWNDLKLDMEQLALGLIETSDITINDSNFDLKTNTQRSQSIWKPIKPFVMIPFYWWIVGAFFLAIITIISAGLGVIVFIPYLGVMGCAMALKRHFKSMEE